MKIIRITTKQFCEQQSNGKIDNLEDIYILVRRFNIHSNFKELIQSCITGSTKQRIRAMYITR